MVSVDVKHHAYLLAFIVRIGIKTEMNERDPLHTHERDRPPCSPNILRTVRRTIIRFPIELLVRRIWFGQFDELYIVLSWLVMRCKLRPELAAEVQQTA